MHYHSRTLYTDLSPPPKRSRLAPIQAYLKTTPVRPPYFSQPTLFLASKLSPQLPDIIHDPHPPTRPYPLDRIRKTIPPRTPIRQRRGSRVQLSLIPSWTRSRCYHALDQAWSFVSRVRRQVESGRSEDVRYASC